MVDINDPILTRCKDKPYMVAAVRRFWWNLEVLVAGGRQSRQIFVTDEKTAAALTIMARIEAFLRPQELARGITVYRGLQELVKYNQNPRSSFFSSADWRIACLLMFQTPIVSVQNGHLVPIHESVPYALLGYSPQTLLMVGVHTLLETDLTTPQG